MRNSDNDDLIKIAANRMPKFIVRYQQVSKTNEISVKFKNILEVFRNFYIFESVRSVP